MWLAGRQYKPNKQGQIVVPYSNRPGRQPIVLSHGDFATLDKWCRRDPCWLHPGVFPTERRIEAAGKVPIAQAMTDRNIPVTYVLFPDEGHGFRRPANSMAFHAVTEAFLAEQLGGRFQPVGDDFEGSTIQVPVGADQVPGLPEALSAAANSP